MMMNGKKALVCVMLAASAGLGGGGCASAPTATEAQAFDYGPAPTLEQTKAEVSAFMAFLLKDPESARYRWPEAPPVRYWVRETGFATQKRTWAGWKVAVEVNAKNAFGGYTGGKVYRFVMNRGKAIAYSSPEDSASWRGIP